MDISDQIARNVNVVLESINAAANRSRRNLQDIRLILVSKAQPLHVVQAAYQSGLQRFGENYPQEAE